MLKLSRLLVLPVLGAGGLALLPGCASSDTHPSLAAYREETSPGFLLKTNYHGWQDALWLSNGKVEAIVVPSIGRVMQFRFAGAKDGPFWENPELLGKPANPKAREWQNFGGDKVWPAPQSQWGEITPTNWPPPVTFAQTALQANVDGWVVTLTSPVDPHYGIRMTRRIELHVHRPMMLITTTFEKAASQTLNASIWSTTQLKDPVGVHTRVPSGTRYVQGFQLMSDRKPPSLQLRDGLLSLARNPKENHKIGLDSGTLIWLGPDYLLRIESPRHQLDQYPDDGASAAIYTRADPEKYVELEMMGPLVQLRRGDTISRTTAYTLLPRTELDPDLEIRKQLPK